MNKVGGGIFDGYWLFFICEYGMEECFLLRYIIYYWSLKVLI